MLDKMVLLFDMIQTLGRNIQ